MNLTDIEVIRRLLREGNTDEIEIYLNYEEDQCRLRKEKAKEKKDVKAVHDYRKELGSVFFQDDDGRFILACRNSIYILNSQELIKAYNKEAEKHPRYQPFGTTCWDKDQIPRVKNGIPVLEGLKKFKEVGTMEEQHKDSKHPILYVTSRDKLVSHSFYKSVVDYASHFLGDKITYSINEKSPIILGESEKGKTYIFGIDPNKKPKVEEA